MSCRPTWDQEIRRAYDVLRKSEKYPDLPFLKEIQKITDRHLDTWSKPICRRGVRSRLDERDVLLLSWIYSFENELELHEIGILACLHLLTFDVAGHKLRSRIPEPNEFLEDAAWIYIHCIALANRCRNDELCFDIEAAAATELCKVMSPKDRPTFPTIWSVMKLVGRENRPPLLPEAFVTELLQRVGYKENLEGYLEECIEKRMWLEAYRVVHGLHDLVGLSGPPPLLAKIFPTYPMWIAWKPNLERLALWENHDFGLQKDHLKEVLLLEGPDSSGQQRSIYRHSQPWSASLDEELLNTLDRSIRRGTEAVRLLVTLCVRGRKLDAQTLAQVNAVLDFESNLASKIFSDLGDALEDTSTTHAHMSAITAITAVMPFVQSSTNLQSLFSHGERNLAIAAPKTLTGAQKYFCRSLQNHTYTERYALKLCRFASILRNATCFHHQWRSSYIQMLQQVPSEPEIKKIFAAIRVAPDTEKTAHADFLAARLGDSCRRGQAPTPLPRASIAKDPVWYQEMDVDRARLRNTIRGIKNIDMTLVTACIKQFSEEHDAFIHELNSIIIGDSDQVCVNLARFFRPRTAPGRNNLHQCWRDLLLHMMRQRPPGLLDRCSEDLFPRSWQSWLEDMRHIFGDRHLGSQGGLGFTREKMTRIARSLSSSSGSTASTLDVEEPQ
ncbi:hypothetical protein F4778DRAFT_761891 [Xylariomycetidae sp. FL2044]|nr:hypothetical protein F4778DRAFT_761891 [Xylariomycetidae sp. FL2044]